MISSLVLAVAMSSTAVPPGQPVAGHAHPGHAAQPTIRVFERRGEDQDRRVAWEGYCRELDQLWAQYRSAGSTPAAWRKYLHDAGQAKRRYVVGDPYLAPIVSE